MKLKVFRNIFSNIVICIIIISIFFISSSSNSVLASGNELKAIYNGNTQKNNVGIMINVYWGTEYLEPMIKIIKENNVKVTFFVGGIWATKNTALLKEMYASGFEIANHGFSHKDHDKLSYSQNEQEISANHKIVKSILGIDMTLFAPPSGAYNSTVISCAKNLGYKTIMWTLDTIDWRDKDANLIYSRATKRSQNGALILMHPTEKTLEALPRIIEYYQTNNYNLTTVSECIS